MKIRSSLSNDGKKILLCVNQQVYEAKKELKINGVTYSYLLSKGYRTEAWAFSRLLMERKIALKARVIKHFKSGVFRIYILKPTKP